MATVPKHMMHVIHATNGEPPPDAMYPKNNWEMVEMLMDGYTCKVRTLRYSDVLAALDHHTINAVVEVDSQWVTVKPNI